MYFEHMNPHHDLEDSNLILIKAQYYLKVERFSTYLDKVQTHGHGDSSILHPHLHFHNRGVTKGITPMRLTKRLTIHQQFNCCHIYKKIKKINRSKKIHQQGHHTRRQITQWA